MRLLTLTAICLLISISAQPSISISRWFSSTYHDLRFTLRRFGHCVGDLSPLKDQSYNETEYLIHQIRLFLDEANFDNEQMANVTALMDNICRSDYDNNYPISVNINIDKYNGTSGKDNRCRSIDEAMDSMYYVFKRAATNKSEPLDFSTVLFYPKANDKTATYNLTDLINTSWIKSDTSLESICNITNSVKDYLQSRSKAEDRQSTSEKSRVGMTRALVEFLNTLLDPILGAQKRLYWESSSRFELLQSSVGRQISNLGGGIVKGVKGTRNVFVNLLTSSNSTRLSASTKSNLTTTNLNSTAARLAETISKPTTVELSSSTTQRMSSITALPAEESLVAPNHRT